jgi:hypothetical protein
MQGSTALPLLTLTVALGVLVLLLPATSLVLLMVLQLLLASSVKGYHCCTVRVFNHGFCCVRVRGIGLRLLYGARFKPWILPC